MWYQKNKNFPLWQLQLGKKYVLQVWKDALQSSEQTHEMMTEIANNFASGKIKQEDLYKHRD